MEFASFSCVAVADFPTTGRGLAVTEDKKAGDVLLEVPLENVWTAARARQAPEFKLLSADFTDKEMLNLHLMVEASKGDASVASVHLEALPSLSAMGLPNFWTTEELSELDGTEVQTQALRLQEELQEDFVKLQDKLASAGVPTLLQDFGIQFKDYQWSWSILASRVMSFTVDGKEDSLFALVPGLDMFNHSPQSPPGLFKLDKERQVVVVRAGHDYAKSDQAYINYADGMCNSAALVSFGFVLPDAALWSSELTLSLQVSQAQLAAHGRILDAFQGRSFQVLHRPSLEEFDQVETMELIVKHRLTVDQPLPPAFIGMVRVQHMGSDALNDPSSGGVITNGMAPRDEWRVLFLISTLLENKLAEMRSDGTEDAELLKCKDISSRKRVAAIQRDGERRVLMKAQAALIVLQKAVLKQALCLLVQCSGRCSDERCEAAGTPWLHRLQAASGRLAANVSSVARLSKGLCDRLPASDVVQACNLMNLWMVGRLEHDARAHVLVAPETWPWSSEGAFASPALDMEQLAGEAEAGSNEYLAIILQKMQLWGSWLISQWAHCDAVQLEDFNCMRQENVQIRNKYAWSVPTAEALCVLTAHQPLLEVGAGTGYWAYLLKKQNVDILTFDGKHFDSKFNSQATIAEGDEMTAGTHTELRHGGPEIVPEHQDRTLVLMWPDFMGFGTYGLECIQNYNGPKLILVGEWRTATFGSFSKGMSENGQSFSLELQLLVEEKFDLVETVHLPTWPMSLDMLRVFKRK